jgi:hypothetical protein
VIRGKNNCLATQAFLLGISSSKPHSSVFRN